MELCREEKSFENGSEVPWGQTVRTVKRKELQELHPLRGLQRTQLVQNWKLFLLWVEAACRRLSTHMPAPHVHVFLSFSRIGKGHDSGAQARKRLQKLASQAHGTRETPQTHLWAAA